MRKLKVHYKMYRNVFDEWLKEEVIELAPAGEDVVKGQYLLHRPIFKLNSTTPIRLVFDASACSEGSFSLNSCLEKGVFLIERISNILLRFRMNRIGVVADIRKAFLQIRLNCSDRDVLRFL